MKPLSRKIERLLFACSFFLIACGGGEDAPSGDAVDEEKERRPETDDDDSTGCAGSVDCAGTEICVDGQCVGSGDDDADCILDSDCPLGQMCDAGTCRNGAEVTDDDDSGVTDDDDVASDDDDGDDDDAACTPSNECATQKCSFDDIWCYDNCGQKTRVFEDCADGETCLNNQCIPVGDDDDVTSADDDDVTDDDDATPTDDDDITLSDDDDATTGECSGHGYLAAYNDGTGSGPICVCDAGFTPSSKAGQDCVLTETVCIAGAIDYDFDNDGVNDSWFEPNEDECLQFELVNYVRATHDAENTPECHHPLGWNVVWAAHGRNHAIKMSEQGSLFHDDFPFGQNVAQTQSPEQAMDLYMNGPDEPHCPDLSHHCNIMNCRFNQVGIGMYRTGSWYLWSTQNFL